MRQDLDVTARMPLQLLQMALEELCKFDMRCQQGSTKVPMFYHSIAEASTDCGSFATVPFFTELLINFTKERRSNDLILCVGPCGVGSLAELINKTSLLFFYTSHKCEDALIIIASFAYEIHQNRPVGLGLQYFKKLIIDFCIFK